MDELEFALIRLEREKKARSEAEFILENKSLELYQANQGLQALATNLADKEKRTNAILNATADGIVVLDKNNEIEICNEAACELFDYDADTLRGMNFNHLISKIINDKSETTIDMVLQSNDENMLYEGLVVRKDKTAIPVELSISKTELSDNAFYICVVRNIYKRKQAEQRDSIRHEITRVLAETASIDEAAPKILKIMCEGFHFEHGGLWKRDKDSNVLHYINAWTSSKNQNDYLDTFIKHNREILFEHSIGLPGRTWEKKGPCYIENVLADPNFPRLEFARKAGLHSAFAFPILFEEEVVGVIEFFVTTFFTFDENFQKFINDITSQIGMFIEREQAQKRIEFVSRLAGMAETASSVLHNIGNILNSLKVSLSMLRENNNTVQFKNLITVGEMLHDNLDKLIPYISEDNKGKIIIPYLVELIEVVKTETITSKEFLDEITEHVKHIEDIVSMQKSISGISGVAEKILISQIIDSAVNMCKKVIESHQIEIIKDYSHSIFLITDKSKLLQILVNLIQNAKDALLSTNGDIEKKIFLKTIMKDACVEIQVIDNGLGIKPEDLTKIFGLGFTTKVVGHGLGLHSSAIAANELGGRLEAKSDGLNKGATFTLTLPLKLEDQPKMRRFINV